MTGTGKTPDSQPTAVKTGVTVVFGSNYRESGDLVGKTVGDARSMFRRELGISGGAKAFMSGKEVRNGKLLNAGDRVEFVKKSGRKG